MSVTSALDQPVALYPLTYMEEDDEVTIGRRDIDSYGLFPPDGAALLRQLEAGRTPNEAASWYADTFGQPVDLSEFLEMLDELELVIHAGDSVAAGDPVKWQRLGKWLFSWPAWSLYGILVTAAAVAMIRTPHLAPSYSHLFFSRSLILVTLGIVFGQMPLVLLHEGFHALAGRRLGLRSTLRIGRRFYYIVFVTSLDGLASVPRRQRYLPMLAGMVADIVMIAVFTLTAGASASLTGAAAIISPFALSIAFGVILRLTWQFYFFLRTDFYYLITTVLGCNDLQSTARQLLLNRVNQALGRHAKITDEEEWHPRDRSAARWYVWLMVSGYVFLVATVVLVAVPTAIALTRAVVHKLVIDPTTANMLDGGIFLVLNFWEPVLAIYLAVRAFRRRRTSRVAAV